MPNEIVDHLRESILAELREEPRRGSLIDATRIRSSLRPTLIERIRAAEPVLGEIEDDDTVRLDPALAPRLHAFADLLDDAIERLEALVLAHPERRKSNHIFTAECHEASEVCFQQFSLIRTRIGKRLSDSAVDRAIKNACSVGVTVTAESPQKLLDHARRMLLALENPENAPRFQARAIELPPLAGPLSRRMKELETAIQADLELTRGESKERIRLQLVFIDVLLERVVVFLEDHGAAEVAARMMALVPVRKRGSGESESSGENGQPPSDSQPAASTKETDTRSSRERLADSDSLRMPVAPSTITPVNRHGTTSASRRSAAERAAPLKVQSRRCRRAGLFEPSAVPGVTPR